MPYGVVREEARDIEIIDDVDVLIVGGGPAGVCAALGAARAGARTMLVERHGFLGGMWTAGMVLTLAGFNSWLRPYQRCVSGIPEEWMTRAAALEGAADSDGFVLNSDPEVMKYVADSMLETAGVRLLFHTWGARPIVDTGAVQGAFVENVDGRMAIFAKVTVDCTGNGDMMARAGAAWCKGNTLQPMTMPFRVGGVELDPAVDHCRPARIPIGPEPTILEDPILSQYSCARNDVGADVAEMREGKSRGELPVFGGPWFGGLEKDVLWVNATRVVGDASDAAELSAAEVQGRKDSRALFTYFQTHLSGFENARLLQTSTQVGVRETRRLVGAYTLTGDDIRSRRSFSDSIAVGCWPIDIHPAGEHDVGVHAMYVPLPYEIPYSALIPEEIGGLLVAGRCISVDRDALGSTRVGATCGATGQAAGVAAALATHEQGEPRKVDIEDLRQMVESQGGIVVPPGS